MDDPAENELLPASDFDANRKFVKVVEVIFSINYAIFDAGH